MERPEPQRSLPPPKAPKLASPYAEGLASQSIEGQIVERLMRGEADHVVADDLGIKLGVVVRLKAKARREGGLVFPGDERTEDARSRKTSVGKGKGPGKGHGKTKGMTLNLVKMPVPAPPYWWQDPNSPVWTNGRLLPSYSESAEGTLGALGPLDHRSYRAMTDAAARHGQTLKQYIDQRLVILRRIEAGEKPTDVALDLRVSPYVVYAVLSKVGRGRMDTLNARPLEARQPDPPPQAIQEPQPAPAPTAAPGRRTPPRSPEAAAKTAQAVRQMAAKKWGFASVQAYQGMRERVRDLRLQAIGPDEIAQRLDMPHLFVKVTLQSWRRDYGVTFPVVVLASGGVRAA